MPRPTLAGRLARAARAFNTEPRPSTSIVPFPGGAMRAPRAASSPATMPSPRSMWRAAYAGALTSRLEGDWVASSQSPDSEIHSDARMLRARARELERNTALVRRYLGLVVENVLGPDGFGHHPQVRLPNGKLDVDTNQRIADAWNEWSTGPVDIASRMTLFELQSVCIGTLPMDGEFLLQPIVSRGERHGLALKGIDADVLDETKMQRPGAGTNEIRMGVELDEAGRRTAYWLRDRDYLPGRVHYESRRVPADELLHVFRSSRLNQTRGVTWLAPIMRDLHTLRGYVEAHLVASRIAASQMGWLQYQKDADGPPQDPNAAPVDPDAPQPALTMEMEPGMIREVPHGMEYVGWAPEYPNTSYAEFVKACERWMASGVEVSRVSLANDLEGVNYSSIRAGLLAERDHWRLLQSLWISWFITPIYRTWMRCAYLSGALELPTPFIESYLPVRWSPRVWPWVDPEKDINAVGRELELFMTSEQRVTAERGRDFFEIVEERKAAREALRTAGLEAVGQPSPAPRPASPAADPDAGDEPDE